MDEKDQPRGHGRVQARVGTKKWKQVQQAREEEQSWTSIDVTKGKYKSLKQLVDQEGKEAAFKYARKCSRLGGSWTKWDSNWEIYRFLTFEQEFTESFAKAWKMRETRIAEAGASQSGASQPSMGSTGLPPASSAVLAAVPPSEKVVASTGQDGVNQNSGISKAIY